MNAENSRVWWALIEEITLRAEEMAGKKEIACCVRGYHIHMGSSNSGSAGVYSMEPTNVGKIFDVKYYSRKLLAYVFCVRKYFYKENKANYGIVN